MAKKGAKKTVLSNGTVRQNWGKKGNPNLVDREYHANLVNWPVVNLNYQTASRYYSQRRRAFLNYWSGQIKRAYFKKIEDFFQYAQKVSDFHYEDVVNTWMEEYKFLKNNNVGNFEGGSKLRNFYTKHDFLLTLNDSPYLKSITQNSPTITNFKNSDQNFYSIMGHYREDDLMNNLNEAADFYLNNFQSEVIQSLLTYSTRFSADAKQPQQGIGDVIIRPTNITIDKSVGFPGVVSTDGKKINFEIMENFSFSGIEQMVNDPNFLINTYQDYLDGRFAGVGTVIAKSYNLQRLHTDTRFLKFASSAGSRETLNSLFGKANYGRGFLTKDFVDMYIFYHFSKNLIQLISPLAVAFSSKNSFMWIDDFLNDFLFYMDSTNVFGTEITKKGGKTRVKKTKYLGFNTGENGHTLFHRNLSKDWYKYQIANDTVKLFSRYRSNNIITMINKTDKYGMINGEWHRNISVL